MTKALSLLLAAAVAVAASPAIAKSTKHSNGNRYAQVVRQAGPVYRGTAQFPVGPLYFNDGTYLGDDPDPFIRGEILRHYDSGWPD